MPSDTAWPSSRSRPSATTTWQSRWQSSRAGLCDATAWRDSGGPTEVSPLESDYAEQAVIQITTLVHLCAVLSLQELCCRAIVSQTSVYTIDRLPLPPTLHSQLRSYALSSGCARHHSHHPNHHEMKMAIKKSRLSHVHAKLTCSIS